MLKVANIIEEGKFGGPQIRIANVAERIVDKCHTTVILPYLESYDFVKYLEDKKVDYIRLPIYKLTKNKISLAKYFVNFFSDIKILKNVLLKHEFNIVHVSGGSWQIKGIIAGKLAKKKIIWHLNDTYAPYVIRFIFIFLSSFADYFVYASHSTKKYYENYISTKKSSSIIPAPVNTNYFKKTKKNIDNKIIVGTVANISPVKGLEDFIHAASKFDSSTIFKIAGTVYPNQKKYYNSLINITKKLNISNVVFQGKTHNVKTFLNNIDIYVCSSNFESSPISVWEAMSMSLPVVSKNVGDVCKFVKSEHNGFIVNNCNEMVLAIKKLISNVVIREKYGKRSREIAKSNLDLNIIANAHIKSYYQLISAIY